MFVRPSAYVDELPLNHHVYDDFWSTCERLGVPVAFHPGVHVDTPGACRKFGLVATSENTTITNMAMDEIHGGSALGQAVGNTVDMIVTMGRLLMGGVCERFPELKLVFLESSGGWVPSVLERMDEQVQAFPLEKRWLSLLPSEYFARQCYVSFEPEEWNLAAAAEKLGTDRILWASRLSASRVPPGRGRRAPRTDRALTGRPIGRASSAGMRSSVTACLRNDDALRGAGFATFAAGFLAGNLLAPAQQPVALHRGQPAPYAVTLAGRDRVLRHASATGHVAQIAFASPAKVSDTGKNTAVSAPWQAASAKKSVDSEVSGLRDIGLLNAARAPLIPHMWWSRRNGHKVQR